MTYGQLNVKDCNHTSWLIESRTDDETQPRSEDDDCDDVESSVSSVECKSIMQRCELRRKSMHFTLFNSYPYTKGTQRWFPPTYIENTFRYPEYF